MKTIRERLRQEVTAAIYGADWEANLDIATAHKPDVEAIMKEVDLYFDEVMREIVPEKRPDRDYPGGIIKDARLYGSDNGFNAAIHQIRQRYRERKNQ